MSSFLCQKLGVLELFREKFPRLRRFAASGGGPWIFARSAQGAILRGFILEGGVGSVLYFLTNQNLAFSFFVSQFHVEKMGHTMPHRQNSLRQSCMFKNRQNAILLSGNHPLFSKQFKKCSASSKPVNKGAFFSFCGDAQTFYSFYDAAQMFPGSFFSNQFGPSIHTRFPHYTSALRRYSIPSLLQMPH